MKEFEHERLHSFIDECIELASTEASSWAYMRVKQHLNGYKIEEPLPRSKGAIAIDEINAQLANRQLLGPILIKKPCKCKRKVKSDVRFPNLCSEISLPDAKEDR